MKALAIDKVNHCAFVEACVRELGPQDVLLNIRVVGLCGSDLNTFSGLNPLVALPRIPGHEIGATISQVGADVDPQFQPGASVIVIPYTTCGDCPACTAGRVNACQFNRTLGVQQDGGLADQLVVNQDRLIVNSTLDFSQMALVEPLSVGFHAISRGNVGAQDTVLVLGGGMIGVGAILGAKARGARVIVSEVSAAKHPLLKAIGADAVLNPDATDLKAQLLDHTNGAGPDVVVEAVGLPQTFREAVDLVSFAGRVVYIGYAKSEVTYNTSIFNLKELDIMGSRNATRTDFEEVIAFLECNSEIASPLISKVFSWGEADQAFDHWIAHRDETFKIMIDVAGGF